MDCFALGASCDAAKGLYLFSLLVPYVCSTGYLDNVRVWQRVLSSEEIRNDMIDSPGSNTDALIASFDGTLDDEGRLKNLVDEYSWGEFIYGRVVDCEATLCPPWGPWYAPYGVASVGDVTPYNDLAFIELDNPDLNLETITDTQFSRGAPKIALGWAEIVDTFYSFEPPGILPQ